MSGRSILATDFQSLSAFRIAFSAYLLGDYFFNIAPYFASLYGETGVLPLAALAGDPALSAVTLTRVLEFFRVPLLLPFLYPVALACLLVGYHTRLATAAAFICNSYLFWRNHFIVSGAEDLQRLLLFWSLFLPLSRYWSVEGALDPQPRDRPVNAIPFAAIRLQISSLYVFSGLFKLAGPAWLSGNAIALALSDNIFGGTPGGLLLVAHAPGLLRFLTWITIAFQICQPLLIYSPWRNDLLRAIALAGSALMHLSFLFFLNVGGFPLVCLIMLLVLVPDAWWNRLLRARRARLSRTQIFYEPGCGFCQRVSLLLREFFLSPESAVLPADADPQALRALRQHNSWVVRDGAGTDHLKWDAMVYVLRQNILSAPLAWLTGVPPLRRLLDRCYDAIGANRRRLAPIAVRLLPIKAHAPLPAPFAYLCGALALIALICNLSTVMAPPIRRAPLSVDYNARPDIKHIAPLFDFLQVGQRWDLFAPRPTAYRRRFVIVAQLVDGSRAETTAPIAESWFRQREDNTGVVFVNRLWLKYFTRLVDLDEAEWSALGNVICRRVDALKSGAAITAVEVTQYTETVDPAWPSQLPPVERHVHQCR